MYKILNLFFLTKTFDNLNSFLAKKIFKIFKVFFIETKLNSLPENNHKLQEIDIKNEIKLLNKIKNENYTPWISKDDLPKLIKELNFNKNKILDVGAGSLSSYSYLEKNLNPLNYLYFDQPSFLATNKEIKSKLSLSNLVILESLKDLENDLDLVYFGSSLQYFKNYKEVMKKIFDKSKFILISLTPFFEHSHKNIIVVKQINMHPVIHYHYIFNIDNFINFMKVNKYTLINKNRNTKIKFMNFKNFKSDYKNIFMYDLIFKRK